MGVLRGVRPFKSNGKGGKAMNDEKASKRELRDEVADVLIAISVISKKIAMKLYAKNMSNKDEEGEN